MAQPAAASPAYLCNPTDGPHHQTQPIRNAKLFSYLARPRSSAANQSNNSFRSWCSSVRSSVLRSFTKNRQLVEMAVGGAGVRVTSTSTAPGAVEGWGRKSVPAPAARRGGCAAAIRCSSVGAAGGPPVGGLAEEHYRTLRLRPGATRGEVKKAFRRLTLMYHPDVCKQREGADGGDCAVNFQRINVAYQTLMSNMREAEERLEYWRQRYGLSDQDLDRYRYYVNDQEDDEWFDM